jgi:hypothetical protein
MLKSTGMEVLGLPVDGREAAGAPAIMPVLAGSRNWGGAVRRFAGARTVILIADWNQAKFSARTESNARLFAHGI